MGLTWVDKINDAGSVEWKVSLGQCNIIQVPSYVNTSHRISVTVGDERYARTCDPLPVTLLTIITMQRS